MQGALERADWRAWGRPWGKGVAFEPADEITGLRSKRKSKEQPGQGHGDMRLYEVWEPFKYSIFVEQNCPFGPEELN